MKKTVMITGADRGVGFAMCRLFAEAGWQVFAGRFLDYWNELDELKEEFPETLELISLDVSSTDSVQKAVLQVQEKTDCIDMLIHCAGIARADGDDALRKILQVNSVGALRVAESFLPVMRQGMKRL
ncbi:MAG: SDR family NAD(P)-dependent oxidoreductase, partial [Oscillospiraceae bacterium]|nr:SDR family NAD(P)-dependent oxidoreductase [Oscillospiraceae bacterium]